MKLENVATKHEYMTYLDKMFKRKKFFRKKKFVRTFPHMTAPKNPFICLDDEFLIEDAAHKNGYRIKNESISGKLSVYTFERMD